MKSRKLFLLAIHLSSFGITFALAGDAQPFEPKIESFPEPAAPPVLCVAKLSKPPTLDGNLDETAWKEATVIENLVNLSGASASVRTAVRVGFDEKNLYIAFDCEEPQMNRVRVKAGAGEDKWPGDAVEVFIDVNRTRQHFHQFVTSHRDVHNDYHDNGVGWDGKWRSKARGTERGWATEMAIPWEDFGINEVPKERVWGFNVTRERVLSAGNETAGLEELMTWIPISGFSSPRFYGGMFFGSRETFANRSEPLKLSGTLDKFVYTTHHPFAHLALETMGVKPGKSQLALQINRQVGEDVIHKETVPLSSSRSGIEIPISSLEPGAYVIRVLATNEQGKPSNALALPFELKAAPAVASSGQITIRQTQAASISLDRWHVRTGVPFPEGALKNPDHVELIDADGKPLPVQTQNLATWTKGGSIKWLGLDYQLPLSAGKSTAVTLKFGSDLKHRTEGDLRIEQDDKTIRVNTGVARVEIKRTGFNFIDQMWVGDKQLIASGSARGPFMADEAGKRFWAEFDKQARVEVEEQSPLQTVIRAEGTHADEQGRALGRYVVRMYFYSGTPYFRTQHTFIITEDSNKTRYSDIGLILPIKGNEVRYGMPGAEPFDGKVDANQTVSLLQRRWDDFVIKGNSAQPSQLAKGDKSPGWFSRGNVALLVRDFWQNFPKELEATPEGLVVHFWPKHGERVWTPEQEITASEAYMLPFVHQGQLLDFRIPPAYFTGPLAQEYGFAYPDEKGGWKLHYGEAAKNANAMGVGKTHDMLVVFGDASKPERITALNDAFQKGVHFLADPKWVCDSEVVGPIAVSDPQKFPLQEEMFSGSFDYLINWTWNLTHAYGMFNFGDSYHAAKRTVANLPPNYYRLWAGYHHGRARIPWLLYLRSGDPKYLAWGRANAQRLIDVNTCHYASKDSKTSGVDGARKEVGGMCDYKGFVPWHQGARVGDYNNMVDFMQLDFFLTGNRRQLDVMHEMGDALIRLGKAYPSREGSGCLGSLLDYYKMTWNPNALLVFVEELPKMYSKPAIEHNPPSVQWAPWLEPWIQYSGDPRARQFLLELANTLIDKEKVPAGHQYYGDGRVMAEAYRLTGENKYLLHAWGYYNKGPGLYDNPKDQLHHYTDWLSYSKETQHSLAVMSYLARWPEMPSPNQPDYTNGRGVVKTWMRSSKAVGELTVLLPEKNDVRFSLGSRFFTRKELQYELINPEGKVIQGGVIPRTVESDRFDIIQARDGLTGDYKLRVFGPDEYEFDSVNMSSLKTQLFLLPQLDYGDFVLSGRFFVFVPANCEKLSVKIRGVRGSELGSSLAIYSPDDKPLKKISVASGAPEQDVEVAVPAELRGKVWSIAADACPVVSVQGIAPWFAATYEGAAAKTVQNVAAVK